MKTTPRRLSRHRRRRGFGTYVIIMGVAMIVSTMGLAALLMVRIRANETAGAIDASQATWSAHSATEHALTVINTDPAWRTNYVSGVPLADMPLGGGTFSWILKDTDGSLAEPDTNLRLTGIGRVGETVRVYSLQLEIGHPQVGPQEFRSQTVNEQLNEVIADQWWCQYLKVTLPPEAIGWKITSLELFGEKWYVGETLHVRLYEPTPPTNMPSTTIIDSLDILGGAFTVDLEWQTINFSGDYMIAPDEGVCIALEATHLWKSPIRFASRNGGPPEADSGFITGNPTWNSFSTAPAFTYRVHGVYMTAGGNMQPVTGSWRWDSAP